MADIDSKLKEENNINYASDSDNENNEYTPSGACTEESYLTNSLPGAKTGPKGVLEDFKRYQELRKLEEAVVTKEKIELHKKLAFTADPNKHPEKAEENDFEDDEFLKKYHEKRLVQLKKEMEIKLNKDLPKFDKLFELNGPELLDAIDKEDRKVIIVVHLYDPNLSSCVLMNKCLERLVQQYPYVKFCKVLVSTVGLSLQFKLNALPTIQVYKEGILIGNFLRMQDKLDQEFYAADVENFLIDSDILTGVTNFADDINDSDCELD